MKEKVKSPGDHRKVSDPIPERKDIIEKIKKNVNGEVKELNKTKDDQRNK